MQAHYREKLDKGLCWCVCNKKCSLGKKFLEELHSWSEINPLHPWLAWKIRDPCYFEGKLPTLIPEAHDKVEEYIRQQLQLRR